MKNRKREIRTSGSVRDEDGQHPHLLGRRRFLYLAAATAALPAVSRIAAAQTYPTRPITMIVPYAPGGTTDVIGRVLAARMRDSLKQSVIIENVSGADGSMGAGRTVRARPDGYTMDLGGKSNHVLSGAFYSLPYDVVNDFAPVAALVTTPFVLYARKSMPAKDLTKLIAWLRANPNRASMGCKRVLPAS
jgi:tripartite-type tricarboxylate transporter receptor subunit TctC